VQNAYCCSMRYLKGYSKAVKRSFQALELLNVGS
jgi:hypothetical protein